MTRYLITGGCGFIGSAFIRKIGRIKKNHILNLDNLTYAGNTSNIPKKINAKYHHVKMDIADKLKLRNIITNFKPNVIVHFAAETHVDRSINKSQDFIRTNIIGTYSILECSREYFETLSFKRRTRFRLMHISTDEVYGDVSKKGPSKEGDVYLPNSPYSASKAAADQLTRAWNKTFSLPIITTHCCNNFGPYQLPEKLIPLIILNAIEHKDLPVYGNGKQIRDWIYVEDNVNIVLELIKHGKVGENYNISLNNSFKNIEIVREICKILDYLLPSSKISSYLELIKYVQDRPSHDVKYELNAKKINSLLHYKSKTSFNYALTKTVKWYLSNLKWVSNIKNVKNLTKRQGLL